MSAEERILVMSSPESLQMGYESLRPLLFGALGRLAAQGFVTLPADGLDVIHDFFAEAWPGVTSHYDPGKGKFEPYVYGAFLQFARPRIVRLQRLQSSLVDPQEFSKFCHRRTTDRLDVDLDIGILRETIDGLGRLERRVLTDLLQEENLSERTLAKKYSVSRYRLREILIAALGKIVIGLGAARQISGDDRRVAQAIWVEERTVSQAAGHLGMSDHQVRGAHERNVRWIADVIHSYAHGFHKNANRRENMHTSPLMAEGPGALLKRVLTQANEEALAELRRRSAEVIRYLESSPDDPDLDRLADVDPEWMARVYGALADSEPILPEDESSVRTLLEATASDEASIGHAFREALLPGLPPQLTNFEGWFSNLPKVEPDKRIELLATPAAQAALPYAEQLAAVGITPLTIFYATEGISMLVDRLSDYGDLNRALPVLLAAVATPSGEQQQLEPQMATREIEQVAECSPHIAHALLPWVIAAGQYRPHVFNGFVAQAHGNALLLAKSDCKYANVYQRWGLPAEAHAASWG